MKRNFYKEKKNFTSKQLAEGILNNNTVLLSKTITYLESSLEKHNKIAQEVIDLIINNTGNAIRIGISGIPGVGKSTFIESIGSYLLKEKKRIAVLAIDPSSQKTKGSILGDKTRMENISSHKDVFIRPSPAGNHLGGVHRKTRETVLLCEAAGFDTIFIETVGVGQSEIAVHSMVDCFLLLMLAGAGDELQGIKRGIMEMADIIAINKAKGKNDILANKAVRTYKNALHLLPSDESGWLPQVLSCSALNEYNIDKIWKCIQQFVEHKKIKNYWQKNRDKQAIYWMNETIQSNLLNSFYKNNYINKKINILKEKVLTGQLSSFSAAEQLIAIYNEKNNKSAK